MSKLIPRATIDALRQNVNISLDVAGIDCTVYIPTNLSFGVAEKLDVWDTPDDLTYLSYSGMVFIDWSPKVRRLKQLGLFVEGSTPILAKFPHKLTPLTGSGAGIEIEVDIIKKSYFRISPEFVPSDYAGTEDFEIVDIALPNFHDAIILKEYLIAPRRVER